MKALTYLALSAGLALAACDKKELTGKDDVQHKTPIITDRDLGGFSKESPSGRRIAMVYYPEHNLYMRMIIPEGRLGELKQASDTEYRKILQERANDRDFLEKEYEHLKDNFNELKNYFTEQLRK